MRILLARNSGIRLPPALIVIVAAGMTVAALAVGHSASGQPGPVLSFDVGAPGGCVEVGVGDEIDVALVITDVEELQAWETTISHDFGIIRILEHDLRIFLAQGEGVLFEASEPLPDNNDRHLLAIGGTAIISVSGSGTLATIKFEAVGAGVSTIDIPQNDFDDNGTIDEGAVLIRNGEGEIGDVNGDNFFDGPVQRARIAVNASCGAPTEEPTAPPTPNPVTPSSSPSATPTPTPIDGGTPTPTTTTPAGQTPTATPVGQTPAPTDTPGAGESVVWGDNNCSGSADPVDSLLTLRFDAGLSANTGDCPDLGQVVDVQNASPHSWGDVDCSGDVTPVDSLKLLRYDAGLGVAQAIDCPPIGAEVTVVE